LTCRRHGAFETSIYKSEFENREGKGHVMDIEVDENMMLYLHRNILSAEAVSVPDYIESTDRMIWKRVWAGFT
jgi:hypothetical protein